MKQKPQFKKIVIAGIGLMGGSLGLALKKAGLASTIVGLARRQQTLRQAKKMRCIDEGTLSLSKAVAGADLVVQTGPVSSTVFLLRSMLPYLEPGCLVTDVGSTKAELLRQITRTMDSYFEYKKPAKRPVFIGSHPMAGSEKAGVAAATGDLYANSLCLLVPPSRTPPNSLRRLRAFWQAVGCDRVLEVSPREHDELTAVASHLPHLTAVCLVNLLGDAAEKDRRVLDICATGFRDTTRIAAGLPGMWVDILSSNREAVCRGIGQLQAKLNRVKQQLQKKSRPGLRRELESARALRLRMEKPRRVK